jgi:hypothetical protein
MLRVSQIVKEFPTSYGTQRFITMFTRAYPVLDESGPGPHTLF